MIHSKHECVVAAAAVGFIVGAVVAVRSFQMAAVIAFVGTAWLHATLLLILHKLGVPA